MDQEQLSRTIHSWLTDPKEWMLYDEIFAASTDEPEIIWAAVLQVLQHEYSGEQLARLAAGPLETILSLHPTLLIDRVEQESARNPKFKRLLGGVWRCGMPQEVWERVQKASGP